MKSRRSLRDAPGIVSVCLPGLCTCFDGAHCARKEVLASCSERVALPVWPEQLGGLPAPRFLAEIETGPGGDVPGERVAAALLRQKGVQLDGTR